MGTKILMVHNLVKHFIRDGAIFMDLSYSKDNQMRSTIVKMGPNLLPYGGHIFSEEILTLLSHGLFHKKSWCFQKPGIPDCISPLRVKSE